MRTRLAHGGAQGADAGIHLPPWGIGGQRIEVHQGIFKTRVRRQWIAGNRYHFGHPAVGERLAQDRLAHQAGCANQ